MNNAPLLYFVPTPGRLPDSLAHRANVLTNKSSANAKGPGPGGVEQRGQIYSSFAGRHLHYQPERQRWTCFEKGAYWIGVDKAAMSDDFERDDMIPGSIVRLDHGMWSIPVANPTVNSCNLPYYDVPDGFGGWEKEYYEQYIEASMLAIDLAGKARELYLSSLAKEQEAGDDHVKVEWELDDTDYRDFVRMMIQVNYDLTLEEMGALRLFRQDKYMEMMFAFIDLTEMLRMMRDDMEAANAPLNPTEAPPDGKSTSSGGLK